MREGVQWEVNVSDDGGFLVYEHDSQFSAVIVQQLTLHVFWLASSHFGASFHCVMKPESSCLVNSRWTWSLTAEVQFDSHSMLMNHDPHCEQNLSSGNVMTRFNVKWRAASPSRQVFFFSLALKAMSVSFCLFAGRVTDRGIIVLSWHFVLFFGFFFLMAHPCCEVGLYL